MKRQLTEKEREMTQKALDSSVKKSSGTRKTYEKHRWEAIEIMLNSQPKKNDDGCWLWPGMIASTGYGVIKIWGRFYPVHQLSYFHFKGKIPQGMVVRHTCDVRACWNPKHLIKGTPKQNSQDMAKRGRCYFQSPESKKRRKEKKEFEGFNERL